MRYESRIGLRSSRDDDLLRSDDRPRADDDSVDDDAGAAAVVALPMISFNVTFEKKEELQ